MCVVLANYGVRGTRRGSLNFIIKQIFSLIIENDPEKVVRPEMTFNDLEGQNPIAYSAIRPNKNMYAKYQVNPCSG